ncbi:MAG: iron ABC transporter permease [Methylomonas sp.]|nr:iron ABC transporter permease [Methylomonas sp.]PPD21695.1 MAG: heme ABC transporter permease [Methylomonas sp.]PPD25760.1 MAG: heme ABC transporter permease [Methylomonas sp.]PPD37007.1 MAG: heme ABC transporter permease [Methylomonas sp.]PPD40673.1 MAG: heme ABC transporter permease [Methylomonas sp.]
MSTAPLIKGPTVLWLLACLLVLTCLLSLGSGAVAISPSQVAAIIGRSVGLSLPWTFEPSQQTILLSIRAPRLLLGLLIGAALAMSGGAIQGLFRNPLADPALIGIASGAALAAVAVIVLQASLPTAVTLSFGPLLLPVAAIGGGFAMTWLVYRLAGRDGSIDVATLLLAGIAINALAGSVTGLLVYIADDDQLRSITFWSLGSLGGASWQTVMLAAPFLALNLLLLPLLATALNALLLGEAEAGHLGFAVARIKTAVVGLVALGVGAAVASSGIIGFVGLVVPHLLRLLIGPDHRWLLPGSALLGALLLLGADVLARTLAAPAEIPIGIITGLLGSPFFLWLLFRQRLMG